MSYNKNKKIFYISDFSLPNMSAYTIHVLKMCDAFSESYYDVSCFHTLEKDINSKKYKQIIY